MLKKSLFECKSEFWQPSIRYFICLLGPEMWRFFDFLVTIRTIVYPLVKPYIHTNLLTRTPDTEEEARLQHSICMKIHAVPSHIHKTQLLGDFANELDKHRKDLTKILGML